MPLLSEHTGLEPSAKDFDFFLGPRSVTRHCAVIQSLKNLGGMLSHIVLGPEIEHKAHRFSIHLPEERLDVLDEHDNIVRRWEFDGFLGILMRSQC